MPSCEIAAVFHGELSLDLELERVGLATRRAQRAKGFPFVSFSIARAAPDSGFDKEGDDSGGSVASLDGIAAGMQAPGIPAGYPAVSPVFSKFSGLESSKGIAGCFHLRRDRVACFVDFWIASAHSASRRFWCQCPSEMSKNSTSTGRNRVRHSLTVARVRCAMRRSSSGSAWPLSRQVAIRISM